MDHIQEKRPSERCNPYEQWHRNLVEFQREGCVSSREPPDTTFAHGLRCCHLLFHVWMTYYHKNV